MVALAERRLIEVHIAEARRRALRLAMTSSTVIPDEWGSDTLNELTVIDVSEFALHARRITELCDFRGRTFPGCQATAHNVTLNDDRAFVDDYHDALNRIVHAQTMVIGYAICTGERRWLNSSKDKILTYVQTKTDRRPTANISLFGIANCFLGEVIIALRESYPDLSY